MILDVFDKNFIRIDNISSYKYASYVKELNNAGSFEVDIALDDVARNIIQNGAYILFERDVLGVISFFNPVVEEETESFELTIKGYLANGLLSRRCIITTANYSGTLTNVVRNIVNNNCVSPSDSKRTMGMTLSTDPKYNPTSDSLSTQVTGDSVEITIEQLLDTQEMGYDVVPILSETSILGLDFRVIKGDNRTVDNTDGNDAVVFSSDLKNMLESSYVFNLNDYKNMAYVAGEGEGSARVIVQTGETNKEGLDRYELYVDARDLQSDNISSSYSAVLATRGNEKLNEHIAEESYTASISQSSQFEYGVHYFLGDLVTIQDEEIGITLNARVVKVQASSLGERTMVDATFGYYKMATTEKLKRNGVI